jgi:hypothetical protein
VWEDAIRHLARPGGCERAILRLICIISQITISFFTMEITISFFERGRVPKDPEAVLLIISDDFTIYKKDLNRN